MRISGQEVPERAAAALTPQRLHTVVAVAETGGFGAAALELGTSQSAVSRSVAAVEDALGVVLFERTTRVVRPTEAGREFLEHATTVLGDLQAAVRAVRPDTHPDPRVVVSMLPSVSEVHLAPALARHPSGPTRLRVVEGLQAAVVQAVVSGTAQAGIGDRATLDPGMEFEPLWTEPFRLAVGRGHRLRRRRQVRIGDLAAERLVAFPREADLRTTVDRELAAARQLRSPELIVDRYRTALSLVQEGLAVMVVPAVVTPSLPEGVVALDVDHPNLTRTVGVIRRRGSPLPRPIRSLADAIGDQVRDLDGVT